MAEAKDKAMWFGVDDGTRRYDGVKWTAYTEKDGLYGAPVNTLCATRDGSVYAGTAMGISRFKEGKWNRVFPPEGDLPWSIYKLMEAKDGSLWAGTTWGALRLSQEGPTLYTTEQMGAALKVLAPDVRLSIVPDEAAPARPYEEIGVRVGQEVGWARRPGIPKVIYALAPGGPGEAAGLKVGDRIIAVDGQPDVTQLDGPAGTSVRLTIQRKGYAKPFEMTVTRGRMEGTFREFLIYDVYEDREGAIWFGLGQGEVVRYAIQEYTAGGVTAWRLYTEKDGLDIGYLPRIIQNRDGVIWTVSEHGSRGVNRFDGKTWTHFLLSDRGGENINPSILETRNGTLWVGGNPHLHVFRDEAWHVYSSPEVSIPTHRTRLLEASDGALWVAGLGQEVARLDYGTARWTTYTGLIFQCETPDGAQWFVSQDSSVVRHDGRGWMRYGIEDGLMDAPLGLIATRKGIVWAAGSHGSTAATAQFDGRRWSLQTHPQLSWGIDTRAVYESSDGSLWFGLIPGTLRGQVGGVVRFDGKTWTHYAPPEVSDYLYGIDQTADGALWVGGIRGLHRFDGKTWTLISEPQELKMVSDEVYATPKGDLWVGTRAYGVFHYDGKTWTRYDVREGVADNSIASILQTGDGSVWVGTPKGISRFDGRTWMTHGLPLDLRIATPEGSLRQSRDEAIWINSSLQGKIRTIRYQPDVIPPHTEITVSLDRVSQPGNTVLAWKGVSPWKATPDEEVQYSYRLDGSKWSPFSHEKNKVFLSLPSGSHAFEVRARDRDFNIDPTPAAIRFTVVPPVWRQPWFIGLIIVFVGITGFQATRIVVRDRRLREANAQLQTLDQLKSDFVSNVSHELRTPLTAIKGSVDNMLDGIGGALTDRQTRSLQRVKSNAERLSRLVNDILDISRIEAERLEISPMQVSVAKVGREVLESVQQMASEKGIALELIEEDEEVEAYADLDRLHQILLNLVSNAIKFTPAGGRVEVRVSPHPGSLRSPSPLPHVGEGPGVRAATPHSPFTSDHLPEDRFVLVGVRDTGQGIPAEELGTIFEKFHQVGGSTAARRGAGLGLTITKHLVELHGGRIWAESEVDKGSTFWFTLPNAKDAKVAKDAKG